MSKSDQWHIEQRLHSMTADCNELRDELFRTERKLEGLREVERERDGLAALVGRLREELVTAAGNMEDWGSYVDEYFRQKHDLKGDLESIAKALAETPPTALREIQARAGAAGYLKGFMDYCSRKWPSEQEFIEGPMADYAQQILDGGGV